MATPFTGSIKEGNAHTRREVQAAGFIGPVTWTQATPITPRYFRQIVMLMYVTPQLKNKKEFNSFECLFLRVLSSSPPPPPCCLLPQCASGRLLCPGEELGL